MLSFCPQAKCESNTVIPVLVRLRSYYCVPSFQNLSADHVITPEFNESNPRKHVYLCRTRGVGSSDESWPLKARRPVLNLGPFYGLGFFCLLRPLRCTSASPLVTRQNSPGIWTRRCRPKQLSTIYAHCLIFFSNPPRRHVIPLGASSMKWTRATKSRGGCGM